MEHPPSFPFTPRGANTFFELGALSIKPHSIASFPHFQNFWLNQNLSLSALADLIRASLRIKPHSIASFYHVHTENARFVSEKVLIGILQTLPMPGARKYSTGFWLPVEWFCYGFPVSRTRRNLCPPRMQSVRHSHASGTWPMTFTRSSWGSSLRISCTSPE